VPTDRLVDPDFLRYQYSDDERLRIRIETHRRHSENPTPFRAWVLERVDARRGQRLLDVGSGYGQYHDLLGEVRVVAIDMSMGMLQKVSVPRAQADAQALPFASASFDRVMANHMLYHVPAKERALAEMRRVTRSPGRVVITTNARDSMRPLVALVAEAARAVGVEPEGNSGLSFGLEDDALVRSVFPEVRVDTYESSLRFDSAEPALRYVASMWVGRLPDASRSALLAQLQDRVDAAIAREGTFRVPTRAGCFVADV